MKLGCAILPLSKQAFFAVLVSLSALAQQAAQPVESNATPKTMTAAERLQQWRLSQMPMLMDDFAELARAHEMKVIYASVLPVHEYTAEAGDMFTQRPPEKIMTLNRWLKNYCASSSLDPRTGCGYLDYFSAMVDDKGYLKKELADDGLHPNDAGYKIMAPMAEAAIEKALRDFPKT